MVKIEVKNGFLIFDKTDDPKFKKAINISKISNIHADEKSIDIYCENNISFLVEKDLIGYPLVAFDKIMIEIDGEIRRQRVLAAYPTCSME